MCFAYLKSLSQTSLSGFADFIGKTRLRLILDPVTGLYRSLADEHGRERMLHGGSHDPT